MPHGLIGQSYDGTGVPRIGRSDAYPEAGNFTMSAMAEGAIEGRPEDYVLPGAYATRSSSTIGRWYESPSGLAVVHRPPRMHSFFPPYYI